MKKLNFKEFGYCADITRRQQIRRDVRREIADLLYGQVQGIVAHDLAFKVYRSEGEIEVTDEEAQLLVRVFEHFTTGMFIDGLLAQLNPNTEKNE